MSRNIFEECGRNSYLQINLDAITENIRILRSCCSLNTGIIGIVKCGAYGHGSVEVSKHLKSIGVEQLAVATASEGAMLRKAGIDGTILVLGNANRAELEDMYKHDLLPSASSVDFIKLWAETFSKDKKNVNNPHISIKLDTGMSRNGVQVDDLASIIKVCDELGILIDYIYTHFAQSLDDHEFTQQQLDTFLKATLPYKNRGIKFHVANTAAVINGYGTDMDFIRPGAAIYGLSPDYNYWEEYEKKGFTPALSWIAKPTLVKSLSCGRVVGYDQTYRCEKDEIIATLSVGYMDGFPRYFNNNAVITNNMKDCIFPLVGKVGSDAITVKINSIDDDNDTLYLLTDDFHQKTSVLAWSKKLDVIPDYVTCSLSTRLPRIYISKGEANIIVSDMSKTY